jgi:hypothetical protein
VGALASENRRIQVVSIMASKRKEKSILARRPGAPAGVAADAGDRVERVLSGGREEPVNASRLEAAVGGGRPAGRAPRRGLEAEVSKDRG